MDLRLKQRLERVAARIRTLRLARWLAAMWLSLAAAGVGVRILLPQLPWDAGPALALLLASLAFVSTVSLWISLRLSRADLAQTARQIEARYPALNERLLAAVHQRPQYRDGTFGYLQRQLIEASVAHDREHGWYRAVPGRQLIVAWGLNLPAFVVFAAVVASLATMHKDEQERLAAASASPGQDFPEPIVVPGDVEVERGSSVIVTAQFVGRIPLQVALHRRDQVRSGADNAAQASPRAAPTADIQPAQGFTIRSGDEPSAAIPMRRSLDDPLFAAYLTEVREPLSYEIEYDGRRTRSYHVRVFDYPAVVRTDAELVFPEYTQVAPKSIVDTRRVSAVVGTELTWVCHVNKPVETAALIDAEGGEVPLIPDPSDNNILRAKLRVSESHIWQVRLVDSTGRANKAEVKLSLKALPNEPPRIKLAAGDVRVSPLEELTVAAKVSDDFGVERTGLTYQLVGGDETDVALSSSEKSSPKTADLAHLIAFEALEAQPDQLLSYYVWAEDRDPAGAVRRVSSDMFFAEVRPFEEIFRQGDDQSSEPQQQQQQQQAPGAQQTEQLLELQKQIVAGTWNVLRKSPGPELPDQSVEDAKVLSESQTSALDLLTEKASEIDVPGGDQLVAAASEHMTQAAKELATVVSAQEMPALKRALAAEQSAYQALLRLQAKEFQVARAQRQSGQQSGSPRSRAREQQLEQLKLENRENRYENERLAQEERPEDSQLRQVQSRLRELAQRQEDLNEQMRELQAALQAADDVQVRDEIEKRLERLREQQQQMLEDADELREQLDQQTTSEALAETQQQMEQTRENLRQSSEALDQGNTSQALSAGTRAEQELKELQEKVRQESAGQFSEAMRQMQQDATELQQAQKQLSEQLSATQEQAGTGLRGSSPRVELEKTVAEQRGRLEKLLNDMRSTVEAAEEPEPLLAQRLYDTFRQTEQKQTDKKLQTTEQLLQRSLTPQAQQLAEQTQNDLQELREGIDSAAEAVLGSEVDSLRLALDQLQQLSHQIEQEVAQATGRPTGSAAAEPASDSASGPTAAPQPDEHSNAENQPSSQRPSPNAGAEQPSDRQPSDRQQSGQQQSGQQQSGQQQSGQQQSGQQQSGQQPAESAAGQNPSGQNPSGQNPSGQNPSGQNPSGQNPSGQNPSGQNPSGQNPSGQNPSGQGGLRSGSTATQPTRSRSGQRTAGAGGATGGGALEEFGGQRLSAPLTGEGFRDWSDRLREVEELVSDPELRGQATQIRQTAREMRSEIKKHAADPQWNLVEQLIAEPLRELEKQVGQELLRKAGDKSSLVPIDRDPVPGQYSESVRRYYENIGSGR